MPDPVIVRQVPASAPQGATLVNVLGTGQLQTLAKIEWPDGRPRKCTVMLSSPGSTQDVGGVACLVARISCGMSRGRNFYWSGFPAIVPVEGNPIYVEAAIGTLPVVWSATSSLGTGGPATVPSNAASIQASATIIEGWSDRPQPQQIVINAAVYTGVNNQVVPLATGPVLVQAATFTNTSASPVQLLVGDRNATAMLAPTGIKTNPVGCVIVPANSSIGLGPDALGSFFRGFAVSAVVSLTTAPATGGYGGFDVNGANVLCNAWGYFVPNG